MLPLKDKSPQWLPRQGNCTKDILRHNNISLTRTVYIYSIAFFFNLLLIIILSLYHVYDHLKTSGPLFISLLVFVHFYVSNQTCRCWKECQKTMFSYLILTGSPFVHHSDNRLFHSCPSAKAQLTEGPSCWSLVRSHHFWWYTSRAQYFRQALAFAGPVQFLYSCCTPNCPLSFGSCIRRMYSYKQSVKMELNRDRTVWVTLDVKKTAHVFFYPISFVLS